MEFLENPAATARAVLVLAHGSGQPMDAPFMDAVAGRIAAAGVEVLRFNFPYMARAVAEGRNRPPDRQPVLEESWMEAINSARSRPAAGGGLFIGGKSLGGRIATLVADAASVDGVVCLGYPFHPPGKPERLRTAHLETIATPVLICQGERDPFGSRDEVAGYRLSGNVELTWIDDGDHGFKPRKSSGATAEGNIDRAAAAAVAFIGRTAR